MPPRDSRRLPVRCTIAGGQPSLAVRRSRRPAGPGSGSRPRGRRTRTAGTAPSGASPSVAVPRSPWSCRESLGWTRMTRGRSPGGSRRAARSSCSRVSTFGRTMPSAASCWLCLVTGECLGGLRPEVPVHRKRGIRQAVEGGLDEPDLVPARRLARGGPVHRPVGRAEIGHETRGAGMPGQLPGHGGEPPALRLDPYIRTGFLQAPQSLRRLAREQYRSQLAAQPGRVTPEMVGEIVGEPQQPGVAGAVPAEEADDGRLLPVLAGELARPAGPRWRRSVPRSRGQGQRAP